MFTFNRLMMCTFRSIIVAPSPNQHFPSLKFGMNICDLYTFPKDIVCIDSDRYNKIKLIQDCNCSLISSRQIRNHWISQLTSYDLPSNLHCISKRVNLIWAQRSASYPSYRLTEFSQILLRQTQKHYMLWSIHTFLWDTELWPEIAIIL